MSRGRIKAKETRLAREIKYAAPDTDLEALRRELSHQEEDEEPAKGDLEPVRK